MRDIIVVGLRDNAARKRLLQEKDLTLAQAVSIARAFETTAIRAKEICSSDDTVHSLAKSSAKSKTFRPDNMVKDCKYCGSTHVRKMQNCKAFNHVCSRCNREHHFERCCRAQSQQPHSRKIQRPKQFGKKAHFVEEANLSEEDPFGVSQQINHMSAKRLLAEVVY